MEAKQPVDQEQKIKDALKKAQKQSSVSVLFTCIVMVALIYAVVQVKKTKKNLQKAQIQIDSLQKELVRKKN